MKTTGTNLAEVKGFGATISLMWKQTKPLFMPPHLGSMLMLCGSLLATFVVSHGQTAW